MYPQTLQQLIENFKALPGVGEKTAERYALTVLQMDEETARSFGESIVAAKTRIHNCSICGNYTETEVCPICADLSRNKKMICVVQDAKDILAIERMKEYNGVYHVLGGAISTNKGILPQDLNIPALVERVDEDTEEVIIATNPTVEGETTALYLNKILNSKQVKITRMS